MRRLILLFVFACGISGFAQIDPEGNLLIKTNGDTITGVFKYASGDDIKTKISVKINDTLKISLKAEEVKFFRDGDVEYVTFQPDGETGHFFVKIMTKGSHLELYEWQMPLSLTGGNKPVFIPYVKKAGHKEYIEIDVAHWKKQFPEYIEDYEELADDVWRGRYAIEQLKEIVIKYNEWKDEQK